MTRDIQNTPNVIEMIPAYKAQFETKEDLIILFAQGFFFSMIWNVNQVFFVTQVKLDALQLVLLGTALETAIFLFLRVYSVISIK